MKLLLDMHNHTIASGHAYSTIAEMAQAAAEKGLEIMGITEHAPKMPGSCHLFYFQNLKVIPREMFGVQLMFGVELNIMDYDGTVDLPLDTLKKMEIVIASFHTPCIKPGNIRQNTRAALAALKNPYIHILGHPDDGNYPLDYEQIVLAAGKNHTLLEVNNGSLNPNGFRINTWDNDCKMLELCKKYQVPVIMGSDAHIASDVAEYPFAGKVVEEMAFPKELIANYNKALLFDTIDYKKKQRESYR